MEERNVELDEADEQILRILQEDASISLSEVSRRLSIPTATVHYKVRRLRETGVIKKFTVLLDPKKLGKGVTMFVGVVVDPPAFYKVAAEFSKLREIQEVHGVTGEFDLLLKVRMNTIADLRDFVHRAIAFSGVKKTISMVASVPIKEEVNVI